MNEEAYVEAETKELAILSTFVDAQVRELCKAAEVEYGGKATAEIEERYLSTIAETYRDATRGW